MNVGGKIITNFKLAVLLLSGLLLMVSGCGVYSLTGASVPPQAKTISIQYFPNKATLVEPTLSPIFTNILRDKFTTQLNLNMVERNGDLAFEGEILAYKTIPVAIQSDQTAAMNRLTITVNVRFVNKYEPTKDFEQKFTEFSEYSASQDFNSVKATLLEQISDALADDIFNKAVINW
jgi:outer membrane lipopolysaccharide assembly protein LptE/RlpB